MRWTLIVIFFFCICAPCLAGKYVYDYDSNCSKAYQYYMSLQLEKGKEAISDELKVQPCNLMAAYVNDYEDCLSLLFSGNKKDYEQRKGHFDERMDILDRGDESSPWYRFCKAGVNLHWALVYFRFGENVKAAFTFRKAFLLIKENERLFPDLEYNKVYSGFVETVTGTIPDNYKWVASIFGLKGSVKKGAALLSAFIDTHSNNDLMQAEAIIYYLYLRFYFLSEKDAAWDYVNGNNFPVSANAMYVFVKANLAVNYRKADMAIQTLDEAEKNNSYSQFPVFDLEMGSALLYKQDTNCLFYFQRFLKNTKGTAFIKDTWQMMGLMYYIQGKMPNARYCKEYIKTHGSAITDADKQAERFSETAQWPDKTLLQAHLLIDGGYYAQALDKLKTVNEGSFHSTADKLEYLFRMGRVYEELKDTNKAFQYYQATINLGKDRPEHFAARSALQMAFIYEKMGKEKEAIEKYEEVLGMHGHDLQASIDQQAKAGINRLTAKRS